LSSPLVPVNSFVPGRRDWWSPSAFPPAQGAFSSERPPSGLRPTRFPTAYLSLFGRPRVLTKCFSFRFPSVVPPPPPDFDSLSLFFPKQFFLSPPPFQGQFLPPFDAGLLPFKSLRPGLPPFFCFLLIGFPLLPSPRALFAFPPPPLSNMMCCFLLP